MDILKRNNVTVEGSDEQVMVFAHGYGCDKHVWGDMIGHFARSHRVVTFDYVGAGASDLSAYDKNRYSSLGGYAKDILEIYSELEISDTILVAHSVSSMIGVLAALENPSLFKCMIFLGPSPRYLNDTGYVGGFEREDLDGLFQMMDENYLGWSMALAPQIMGNADHPEYAERLTNNFCATDPEIAKQFARVTFLSDNRADITKLEVPTLTLQCTADIIAPVEVGEYMHANMKNNTLVVMEATGHCPHMSAPKETIRIIEEYLKGFDGREK